MMGIGKDQLVLNTSDLVNSDNVGAYLRSSDGTLITKTTVSGKDGLDVNLINASIDVTATNLDIRDLAFATDKVDVSGSTVTLDAGSLAALESITVQNGAGASAVNIQDGGNSITVDGTVELGATTLSALENITIDAVTGTVTVQATNLDIRDLTHVSDSVKIGDGTDLLAINNDGSINVQISGIDFSYDYAEDAVHSSGDVGAFVLGVRDDVLSASTSADGDYSAFKTDKFGRMWVNEAHQNLSAEAVTVGTSAVQLIASSLSGRKRMLIQNLGTKPIFLGPTGVTTSSGIRIANGANAEFLFDENAAVYAISGTAGQDVRIMELA